MPISKTYKAAPIFHTLGDGYGDPVKAASFPKRIIRFRHDRHARSVGLSDLSNTEWVNHFGQFKPLPNNLEMPIAQRYHGHQFRHYNPDIGDGRGFLFAQLKDDQGRTLDLGTKGSGTTPYSRAGDGRLTLKGGVREIMATEMLEALGVNTSKTFSLIETGENLTRGDEPSPTRSAVMTRLSHGHIRIGSFQRLAYFGDHERIQKLVDYCLKEYWGITPSGNGAERCLQFLDLVSRATARLTAETLTAGFVHGVLNSDNINVTGESFDYGPWRFLDRLDPDFTAAYFDQNSLYCYGRQPEAIHWDTYQLAGSLSAIVGEEGLQEVMQKWSTYLTPHIRCRYLEKLGVKPSTPEKDDVFLKGILDWLVKTDIPFEQFFFDWFCGPLSLDRADSSPFYPLYALDSFQSIKAQILARTPDGSHRLNHAYFRNTQPCTMLIDEVETLWSHIDKEDDWQPLYDKIDEIRLMGKANDFPVHHNNITS